MLMQGGEGDVELIERVNHESILGTLEVKKGRVEKILTDL